MDSPESEPVQRWRPVYEDNPPRRAAGPPFMSGVHTTAKSREGSGKAHGV